VDAVSQIHKENASLEVYWSFYRSLLFPSGASGPTIIQKIVGNQATLEHGLKLLQYIKYFTITALN
jgi:hypothetical protein